MPITHLGHLDLRLSRRGRRQHYTGLYGITNGYSARGGTVTVQFDAPVPTADGRTMVNGSTFGIAAVTGLREAIRDDDRTRMASQIAQHVVQDLAS
jgi:hypothetical protein